ncbi:MAG: hypothetical protein OEL57_15910 [Trichlorobacter sp.]|uniref:hypothetical protein n=1 Tax=Trichlorobacter sp. TaxID=2911007 RepID=UPI00256C7CEE|nr:hypothetical protein [Trichlorobacter sp.]MDK9719367.1 hypothetical protein [Trichlorobacter sp.]
MSVEVFIRMEVDINQLPQLLNQLKGQLASFPHQIEIIGDGQSSGSCESEQCCVKAASGEKLPIRLFPGDEGQFKQELLRTRRAEITTFYTDGKVIKKTWVTNSFSETSGVMAICAADLSSGMVPGNSVGLSGLR